jgi:hypothetical protein
VTREENLGTGMIAQPNLIRAAMLGQPSLQLDAVGEDPITPDERARMARAGSRDLMLRCQDREDGYTGQDRERECQRQEDSEGPLCGRGWRRGPRRVAPHGQGIVQRKRLSDRAGPRSLHDLMERRLIALDGVRVRAGIWLPADATARRAPSARCR